MARRRKLIKPADAVEVPVPDPKVVYEETPSVDQAMALFMAMNLRDRWLFLLKSRNVPVTKTARPMMPQVHSRPKAPALKDVNSKVLHGLPKPPNRRAKAARTYEEEAERYSHIKNKELLKFIVGDLPKKERAK